ncbi:MAG: DUF1080 domain-containing protein [Allomuricauda sp.]
MKSPFPPNLVFLAVGVLFFHAGFAQSEWENIFNGKDLKNWERVGGDNLFVVRDGVLIGKAKKNTPPTFLTTKKRYGDFILEFDVYFDTQLNSGVQIRSNAEHDKIDRLYGYQIEIDPSERGYSGGFYEEARRGWLYPLSRNNPARTAVKFAQWNTYHIEAIGNTITTWVNGIQCTRSVDNVSSEGVIGLQIHEIPENPELDGAEIKWRNFRILTSNLEVNQWKKDLSVPEISYLVNELTDWEKDNGYRLLWDGKTKNGWKSVESDTFPEEGWQIENGSLKAIDLGKPMDIITEHRFRNFELELEFKIDPGADSGVKYFVDSDGTGQRNTANACEFQIIDDDGLDLQKKGDLRKSLSSLSEIIPYENLSVKGGVKRFRGLNTWNKIRIVSRNGKVEHWLNNEKSVEFDRFSQMFKSLIALSPFADSEDYGQAEDGHILLQNLNGRVCYRSIKIRELNY